MHRPGQIPPELIGVVVIGRSDIPRSVHRRWLAWRTGRHAREAEQHSPANAQQCHAAAGVLTVALVLITVTLAAQGRVGPSWPGSGSLRARPDRRWRAGP